MKSYMRACGGAALIGMLAACGEEPARSVVVRDPLGEPTPRPDAPPSAGDEEVALGPQPAEAADNEIGVVPVFFLPKGAELSDEDYARYDYRVRRHLRIAQRFYLSQLQTETFRIEDRSLVVKSPNPVEHFGDPMADADRMDELTNLKSREVLEALGEDRFTSKRLFVILFVRPADKPCGEGGQSACLGFGRPFSGGAPVVGGGVVEIDLDALVHHDTQPFQSTLAHELGHAFGLSHVDCRGYDLWSNDSIMSYRLAHHSRGFEESATPGILIAEDLFVLAQNKGVFPGFEYVAARHNPTGAPLREIEGCYLPPMGEGLTPAPPESAQGYRLFFDGALASGPETAYWPFSAAKDHCKAMVESAPGTRVTCTFNGAPLDPSAPPPI